MRRELVVATLTLAFIMFVPGTHGQDADLLAQHAQERAGEAQQDPGAFAANATTPEWQRAEFNFTVSWACDAAEGTPARDALEELGACETLRDVAAEGDENEDEADEDHAHAEELDEADEAVAEAEALAEEGANALDEEVAAAAELLDDTAADPLGFLAHAEKFAKATLGVVGDLLGLVLMLALAVPAAMLDAVLTAADLAVATVVEVLDGLALVGSLSADGFDATVDGLLAAVGALADGVANVGSLAAAGAGATADALGDAASSAGDAVADAASSVASAVTSAVSSTVDAIGDFVGGLGGGDARGPRAGRNAGDAANGAAEDATGLVDGLVDALPV